MIKPHSLSTSFSGRTGKLHPSLSVNGIRPEQGQGWCRMGTVARYLPKVMLGVCMVVGIWEIDALHRPISAATLSPGSDSAISDVSASDAGLFDSRPSMLQDLFRVSDDAGVLLSQVSEIQRGDRGRQVEELQKRLRYLGYFNGNITGYFGDITEAAVIRFQADHGLTQDGIVGVGTTDILRKAGPASSVRRNNPLTLEKGDQGPAVRTLQNQLTTLGYYDGPITGYFGPLTEAALMRFQSDRGLTSDGIVGDATQSALDQALQGQEPSQNTVASASDSGANRAEDVPDPDDGVWENGENGEDVAAIQEQLRTLGYYDRAIDGDYGSGTEAAVIEFQRSQDLTADGKAGPNTLAALDAALNSASGQASTSTASTSGTGQQQTVTPASANSSRVSSLPPTTDDAAATANATSGTGAITTPPNASSSGLSPADPNLAISPNIGERNVLEVQRQLRNQGFYDGELDGQLGPRTRRAIQDAQQTYGLQRSDFE